MSLTSAVVLLFLVMDPLGNVPFFAAALDRVALERQNRVVLRELLVAYGVMVLFLFAGGPVLKVLNISETALTLAGGVVLFLIAIRMVFPPAAGPARDDLEGEPFIVPLAIPYVAGPSVLATLLLMVNQEPGRWPEWLAALTVAWAVTASILLLSGRVRRILGQRGMIAIERLMGMVLVAIAVQMFLNGLERYLQH
jgi:multiple antibiotic resistance protein